MSQPSHPADSLVELPGGVIHWTVDDERIRFRSEAYAVREAGECGGWIAIDPLPLTETALARLRPLHAIYLTGAFHQRSAWDWRARFGAPVWVPRGAAPLGGDPDRAFDDRQRLAGGLTARIGAGPSSPHAIFLRRDSDGELGVFSGDLLMERSGGGWMPVPESHRKDPPGLLRSIEALAKLRPTRLYPAHGAPQTDGAAEAVDAAWRELAGTQGFEPR